MNHFSTKEKLAIHEEYCLNNEAVKIEMPDKGSVIKFKNHNRSIRVPFIVYAEFECLVEPINGCEPSDKKALPISIKNINLVDFVIISNVSMIIFILKNQHFIE